MKLIELYQSSLKKKGSEEFFDLILFRPLGFLTAFLLKNTPVSPNAVTLAAMSLGMASGWAFYFHSFELGALLLFCSNWLDCSDGQLARMQKVSSKMGMILDGFADYVVYVSINAGAFFAIIRDRGNLSAFWTDWIFWAGLLAGISTVVQAAVFDRFRTRYTGGGTLAMLEDEQKSFLALQQSKPVWFQRILIFFYLIYLKGQIKASRKNPELKVGSRLIRLLSFVGSTTHVVLFIFFALIHRMEGYLFLVGGVMNVYLFLILFFKNKINGGEI